jgi:hypothetical protein
MGDRGLLISDLVTDKPEWSLRQVADFSDFYFLFGRPGPFNLDMIERIFLSGADKSADLI